jgi:hypothetical protein
MSHSWQDSHPPTACMSPCARGSEPRVARIRWALVKVRRDRGSSGARQEGQEGGRAGGGDIVCTPTWRRLMYVAIVSLQEHRHTCTLMQEAML